MSVKESLFEVYQRENLGYLRPSHLDTTGILKKVLLKFLSDSELDDDEIDFLKKYISEYTKMILISNPFTQEGILESLEKQISECKNSKDLTKVVTALLNEHGIDPF